MAMSEILATLRHLETELHRAETRINSSRLNELLHPEFIEFGRSGRVYSRAEILSELTESEEHPEVEARDFRLVELEPDVVLLTYISAHRNESGLLQRNALRSSVWQLGPSGWQMRFHQGTPIDD